MHHKLNIDESFIRDIDLHSSSLKDTIHASLTTADQDKATTDINYVKNLIDHLVPEGTGLQEKAVLLLFILHGYSEQHDIQLVADEVKGFFTTLCLTLLHDLDFAKIYRNRTLRDLFNEMLTNYLNVCNELKTERLLEALVRFKQQIPNNNLLFFQVHTVKQLFYNNCFDTINHLITEYSIDFFDTLMDRELIQQQLFSYFHFLSYASTVSKSYDKAYEIIHILMDLNVFVEIPEFQQVLSEYLFLSLILGKSTKSTDVTIYKFKTKLFPRLLKIYQSFQAHDLESFVFNFFLYIRQLDHNDQKLLSKLYNLESLTALSHEIIDTKFDLLSNNFDEDFLLQQQTSINELIGEINKKLTEYGLQLPYYQLRKVETPQILNHRLLLRDCQRLASFNQKSTKSHV